MVYKKCNKWLSVILLVCSVFAITGSFALFANKTSGYVYNTNTEKPDFTGISITHSIDWLAGNTYFRRTHGFLLSALRNGFFWVFLLAGIPAAAIKFARSYLLAMKSDNTSIKKNTILINLRN